MKESWQLFEAFCIIICKYQNVCGLSDLSAFYPNILYLYIERRNTKYMYFLILL